MGLTTTWLDDAGNMRVQMLLMGDRLDNDGSTRRVTRFSTRYGAGRLKMRHRSDAGMDAPWLSRSGYVDMEDGEIFQRWVSSDGTAVALDADVNAIVAVAWWFEPDTTTSVATADLELLKYQSNCTTYVNVTFDASADTRKRVFRDDIAGSCLQLEINAFDVPVGETRRVYWAYYYEDTDRDDANGPTLSNPVGANDVELP